jgi:hypothetical protein
LISVYQNNLKIQKKIEIKKKNFVFSKIFLKLKNKQISPLREA